MRRRVWLVRIALFGLMAAAGSLPYGCGLAKKADGAGNGDAGAGGEGDATAGGSAALGGAPGDGAIVPCTSDRVCRDSGRLCDTDRSLCVLCRTDADCGSQELCIFAECVAYTPCENSLQCPTDQVCNETAGVCVECVGDGDCSDDGVCVAAQCRARCESDKTCVPSGQLCDEANGYCLECIEDDDCGSDAYCGAGACQPGVCQPGDSLCLGTALLVCDVSGSGYPSREWEGCSETDGAHCVGEQGVAGAGGMSGVGGEGGSASECGDTDSDAANCGACGYVCVHGRECVSGRCTPAWQPLVTDNAPLARTRHAAGFVAGQYVVLGGSLTTTGLALDSTAAYDVNADAWSDLEDLNSARCSHEAVSTGADILTFGGLSDCGNGNTTGPGLERFTPDATDGAWSSINAANAPGPRYNFAASWTGTSLFIYGGGNTAPAVATGGVFSPAGPTWSDAGCPLQGCERGGVYSAFTDGGVVHIWGGGPYGNAPAGLTYDLTEKAWSAWQVPASTAEHLAQRFADDGRRIYFLKATNVLSIYDRQSSSWLPNDTAAMPAGFCPEAAAAWTGVELIAWSGDCGSAAVNVGGRYQPAAPN